MTLLDVALLWTSRGAAVFPVALKGGRKRPLTQRGHHDASNDAERVRFLFEYYGERLPEGETLAVGMVPGSAGWIVVDVDVKGETNGWTSLGHLSQDIPPTYHVLTPSGGGHLYYHNPDPSMHVGNSRLAASVDIRSDAGWVVAPGSAGYEPLTAYSTLSKAPKWLLERLERSTDTPAAYAAAEERMEPRSEWSSKILDALNRYEPEGSRHETAMAALTALASYELLRVPGATSAISELREAFVADVAEDRGGTDEAVREWGRMLRSARLRVQGNESAVLAHREWVAEVEAEHGTSTLKGQPSADAQRVANMFDVPAELIDGDGLIKRWTMPELLASDLTLKWVVKGALIHPTYGMIAGESKSFKSYLAIFLALAVATGEPFLGQFEVQRPGPVNIWVGEGGRVPFTLRAQRIAKCLGLDLSAADIEALFEIAPATSERFQATNERDLVERGPVLTIIDPYYAYHGATVNSASLHEEGNLLTSIARPFVRDEASLMIVNHMNKTGAGDGLKRITMSGGAEWCDSWMLTKHREVPDLDSGTFKILLELGSRQWGGSKWDLDLCIGSLDELLGEARGDVSFELRPHEAGSTNGNGQGDRRDAVLDYLRDAPYQMTKTEVIKGVTGREEENARAFDYLAEAEVIDCEQVGREDAKGRVCKVYVWGVAT